MLCCSLYPSAILYVTSLSDQLIFNISGTALDATGLEVARQACASDNTCGYLAVQNNGPYVGMQQWTYLSSNNPPWTPYPYVETPLFASLNGSTFATINALLGVYQTIKVNVITPPCPIGSTPFWDIATNEQICISQTDRARDYNILWYITFYVALLIAALIIGVMLWYLSYIPAYLKNLTFKGEMAARKHL